MRVSECGEVVLRWQQRKERRDGGEEGVDT